ncbi:uncharacterized protein BHQ10_005252 [Talaromyces amestolkiae]|uniref:Uncharacterized protein n=1 Tax=Talaromyces amestolkiae TaxID=1196081 RepID=A0A364L0B6_TALAM|nr:uncharacterized protein BHQ10_005252 [Talaromyces amestolkiae]RAO69240.1 hypothetical protein BHQ10_005252 [Talaromyces amestolkiae]
MTTTTSSDTSAPSSIVLQSMESAKSIDSSVGVTSMSEGSHYSQISVQKQKRGFKQAWSFSSLRKKENGEKNPFKWLCRRSDASIRHSTSELKLEQQGKLEEEQSHGLKRQTLPPQTIPFNLGPVIVQRMERLEEKIDIISSGLFFASRNTTNSTNLKTGNLMPDETPQNTYPPPQTNLDMKNHLKILTAEITHLTKSNNNLSSCIDALGSSGLIDLLEILSCSLERLHAAVTSLREEQKQCQQQQAINPNRRHETQLDLQMELIQRLGFLLGQREEQLKHERKLNQSYRRSIEGLEEMIRALEEEWERAMPVMAQSGYVHVEGLADCIRKLSTNGE